MDLLATSVLSGIAGFCAKFSDEASERKVPLFEAVPSSLLWGLLAGLLAAGGLSSLFFALALASLLAGKFDHPFHFISLAAFILVVFALPMPSFNPWLFSLFLLAALVDELSLPFRPIALLARERLWLWAATLIAGVWTGEWIFLFAIVSFDALYRAGGYLSARLFPPRVQAKMAKARKR